MKAILEPNFVPNLRQEWFQLFIIYYFVYSTTSLQCHEQAVASTSFHVCWGLGGQDLLEVWWGRQAVHVTMHQKWALPIPSVHCGGWLVHGELSIVVVCGACFVGGNSQRESMFCTIDIPIYTGWAVWFNVGVPGKVSEVRGLSKTVNFFNNLGF